ncbi:MAG: hypothetical protein JW795_03135 [Chitinivibrionales bacterium]|nr:hypothetical protein [Chitinivibrionales bacterium]
MYENIYMHVRELIISQVYLFYEIVQGSFLTVSQYLAMAALIVLIFIGFHDYFKTHRHSWPHSHHHRQHHHP